MHNSPQAGCSVSPDQATVSAGSELSGLLQAWNAGDSSALDRLTPIVYAELHRLARRQMAKERAGHLLQPSALVNEAFMRLMGYEEPGLIHRSQFLGVSARLMRQILVDFARTEHAQRRGRGFARLQLTDVGDLCDRRPAMAYADLIAIDQALHRLAEIDERQAQVVELRFFGGLENLEIASVLGLSESTVIRSWRLARARLFSWLGPRP